MNIKLVKRREENLVCPHCNGFVYLVQEPVKRKKKEKRKSVKRQKITDAERNRVLELQSKGYSVNQIAEELNKPHSTIWYIAARNSGVVKIPKTKITRKKITDEEKAQIFQMKKNGFSIADISRKMNRANSSIRGVLIVGDEKYERPKFER